MVTRTHTSAHTDNTPDWAHGPLGHWRGHTARLQGDMGRRETFDLLVFGLESLEWLYFVAGVGVWRLHSHL